MSCLVADNGPIKKNGEQLGAFPDTDGDKLVKTLEHLEGKQVNISFRGL